MEQGSLVCPGQMAGDDDVVVCEDIGGEYSYQQDIFHDSNV